MPPQASAGVHLRGSLDSLYLHSCGPRDFALWQIVVTAVSYTLAELNTLVIPSKLDFVQQPALRLLLQYSEAPSFVCQQGTPCLTACEEQTGVFRACFWA